MQIEERLAIVALATVIMYFDNDGIEEYGSLVAALDQTNINQSWRNWSWI